MTTPIGYTLSFDSMRAPAVTPILLLEINEVPWRLIDHYAGRHAQGEGLPNIRRFFGAARQYTSWAVDTGELSPWVTWPTLHRGMNNRRHGILNLGQDPATFRGTPVWQDIRDRGGSIGVCGSMQSWPPVDPGPGGFYLPDTFAHDARCIPSYVEPFQQFNLNQVKRNARVVDGAVPTAGLFGTLASMLRSGVRLSTFARVAAQVAAERVDRDRAKRRPVFQGILFWDVFRKHFDAAKPPAFSTFFTNHVAGVMHRYWHDVFPDDFQGRKMPAEKSQEPLMRFALETLDDMLGDVLNWCDGNPGLVVVFASSMGQGAIHRDQHEGVELVVEDLARLLAAAGAKESDYRPLLAMVPQVAIDVRDANTRSALKQTLTGAVTSKGNPFICVQEIGDSLSITVKTPARADIEQGHCTLNGRVLTWQEAGIRAQEVEPGTGYHIPEGSLAFYHAGLRAPAQPAGVERERPRVMADEIKQWLLRIAEQGKDEIDRPPVAGTQAAAAPQASPLAA
jgi:hypothetical protein